MMSDEGRFVAVPACSLRCEANVDANPMKESAMKNLFCSYETRDVADPAGVGRDLTSRGGDDGRFVAGPTVLVRCVPRIGVDLGLLDGYLDRVAARRRELAAYPEDIGSYDVGRVTNEERRGHYEVSPISYPGIIDSDEEFGIASKNSFVAFPDARVASPEVRVASPEVRVASPEVRVASPESRVASPEVRVASPESRVASPESRVASPEVRVASPVTFVRRRAFWTASILPRARSPPLWAGSYPSFFARPTPRAGCLSTLVPKAGDRMPFLVSFSSTQPISTTNQGGCS
jgi:hypothetical protein